MVFEMIVVFLCQLIVVDMELSGVCVGISLLSDVVVFEVIMCEMLWFYEV